MTPRTCIDCGEPLTGRADKKFCSDYCRNAYHNKESTSASSYVRQVNAVLRKNRKLLLSLNPNGKSKQQRKRLVDQGFNFDYFTNTYTTRKGDVYFFCYEQGYLYLDNDWVMLVSRDNK